MNSYYIFQSAFNARHVIHINNIIPELQLPFEYCLTLVVFCFRIPAYILQYSICCFFWNALLCEWHLRLILWYLFQHLWACFLEVCTPYRTVCFFKLFNYVFLRLHSFCMNVPQFDVISLPTYSAVLLFMLTIYYQHFLSFVLNMC